MAEIISVTALNRFVKGMLENSDLLFDLAVSGEIMNFKQNAKSGHCYFSLRDSQSSINAVMFRGDARALAFRPEDGMKVVARGRVTLYEPSGSYQLVVNALFPAGIGSAQAAFEQLKAKLAAEGIFDQAHKKPLPPCPKTVGLVTSKTGAALQDILNVTARRWPLMHYRLYPVSVQGFEAAEGIVQAIRWLDRYGKTDVIVVTRGGGSREDLWVFNDERIARAIYACKTPVVTAIGHEIDYTIADFAADLRAPTPSAAAELVTPNRAEFARKICILQENMQNVLQQRLDTCYNQVKEVGAKITALSPGYRLEKMEAQLAAAQKQIALAMEKNINEKQRSLAQRAALLHSLSPYQVLGRGYTITQKQNGDYVSPGLLQAGDDFVLRGKSVLLDCTVQKRKELADENTEEL